MLLLPQVCVFTSCITRSATGFSAKDDQIVEIAMQETESAPEYSTLVSCAPREVHWRAQKAHGISTEELHRHGLPFK